MSWHAKLSLNYRVDAERTALQFAHEGPLRVLQSLYPEGPGVCHNVLVHPPSGLVGGDVLDVQVSVGEGAHGLITTPGATRFYRSKGAAAVQRTHLQLAPGARLEWLPLEAICYSGCAAENKLSFDLAPGAELLGWDITVLGLPHADLPFVQGRFTQHIEWPGVWLERGAIAAADARLLDSPLGLAGKRCMASLWFASGTALTRERRELGQDAARQLVQVHTLAPWAGVTSPNPRMLVLRALATDVEQAHSLLRQVWAQWRADLWQMDGTAPRIWKM